MRYCPASAEGSWWTDHKSCKNATPAEHSVVADPGERYGCAQCCQFMVDCVGCGEAVYTKVKLDAEYAAQMARCRPCRVAWLSG